MNTDVYAEAESVALEAAKLIAEEASTAVATRGKFVMAVSGGKTPWIMLRDLTQEEVPWNGVHVVQVDERVAPEGDPERKPHAFARKPACSMRHCVPNRFTRCRWRHAIWRQLA